MIESLHLPSARMVRRLERDRLETLRLTSILLWAAVYFQEQTTMSDEDTYTERVSSNRTEALFLVLALVFLILFIWRWTVARLGILTILFFCLFILFLFYSLNYRTLVIRMTTEMLELKFGIFTWKVPWETIERCYLDETSLWRIGGAGTHFSSFGGRYRAMLNFLEFPRVVLALKVKKGPVWDIAFSTRHPEQVMGFIQGEVAVR